MFKLTIVRHLNRWVNVCIDPFMPRRCVFSLNAVNFFRYVFCELFFDLDDWWSWLILFCFFRCFNWILFFVSCFSLATLDFIKNEIIHASSSKGKSQLPQTPTSYTQQTNTFHKFRRFNDRTGPQIHFHVIYNQFIFGISLLRSFVSNPNSPFIYRILISFVLLESHWMFVT